MKFAIFASLLFSLNCFASAVSIEVTPKSPVVITSDLNTGGQVIEGPWFSGRYLMTNTESQIVTIDRMDFKVISREGNVLRSSVILNVPQEIAPGSWFEIGEHYTGNLPASASFEYKVRVTLHGWMGTVANPGTPITETIEFVTQ